MISFWQMASSGCEMEYSRFPINLYFVVSNCLKSARLSFKLQLPDSVPPIGLNIS